MYPLTLSLLDLNDILAVPSDVSTEIITGLSIFNFANFSVSKSQGHFFPLHFPQIFSHL